MEIMVFNLFNSKYGISLDRIKGILVYEGLIITPLFNETEWITGVTNLRGEVIAIVDLKMRFTGEKSDPSTSIVMVVKTSENKIIGIVVDSIEKIAQVDQNRIMNSPDVSVGMDSKYIKGMVQIDTNEMVTLVNIDTLLSIDDL